MQDRRLPNDTAEPSVELVHKGKSQLESEIKLIEGWLLELDGTSKDNPEALAARKNYEGMLQSRRDLLQSLQKQRN